MFDPNMYDDDVALTTHEVAAWTGFKPRTVLSLPNLVPLDLKVRGKHYRAGDVKDAILGDRRRKGAGTRLLRKSA